MSAARLAADRATTPFELALGTDSRLVFELSNADLHLTSRVKGLPALRARAVAEGETAGLEATSSGGSLTVHRPDGDTGVVRLRLDLALGPGRTVHIAGNDLDVRVDETLPVGQRSAHRLTIENSRADLKGARVSQLEASASTVTLSATDGALALTLTGGSARVRGHRGRLELDAVDAGVTVAEHAGDLAPRLTGGRLEVVDGAGAFDGDAVGAEVSLDDWRGPVDLRGRDSVITVRGVEHRDRWRIAGRELQVILEGVLGDLEAELEGGYLEARNLAAAVRVTAGDRARLELVDVAGSVHLTATGGTQTWVAGVAGGVEADVTDSRLEVERLDRLTLIGTGADVSVDNVDRAERLELRDSRLSLDLRAGRATPVLDLSGGSYADVRLKAPCVVQLGGRATVVSQAQVTGCELRPPGHVVPRRQDRLRFGEAPTLLGVTITPDSVLEVEGEP